VGVGPTGSGNCLMFFLSTGNFTSAPLVPYRAAVNDDHMSVRSFYYAFLVVKYSSSVRPSPPSATLFFIGIPPSRFGKKSVNMTMTMLVT